MQGAAPPRREPALVDLVAAERLRGRRELVYATHTGTRGITGRMEDSLRHGFRVADRALLEYSLTHRERCPQSDVPAPPSSHPPSDRAVGGVTS